MFGKVKQQVKKSLKLTSFFSADDILIQKENCARDESIRRLLVHLSSGHGIPNTGDCEKAILERESFSDTVVSPGIAIPHARVDGLQRPYVGVLTSENGIPFSEAKPLVHLVFLVLIPTSQPALYLQILKVLANLLKDSSVVTMAAKLKTPDEVMRFFERGGLVLPEYLCAADIMCDTFETLKENESLKKAIDHFISHNVSEIPVVDQFGDMVGVVSAKALLKVCLPDYLLWMHDLSPIVNFEPFTNVLRNEQNSWLSDILSHEFASVQMSLPAISVAGEMSRRDTATCYVLNGKKLMGTISLPLFLNKIFRE